MDWKSWTLLIILFGAIIAGISTCTYFLNKNFEEKKGIKEPVLYQKEFYIKAIDQNNTQIAVNLQIYHNGTYKEIHTNSFNWEVTNIFSDHTITAYGDGIMLEKSACDMVNDSCIIRVKKKGVFIPQLGHNSQEYPILLPFRISCVNGTCDKAKVCWDWGKDKLSEALEIRSVSVVEEKQVQGYCFEDVFAKEVLDFTLAVEYFTMTDNDFIEVEVADWSYYKEGEAIEQAYEHDGDLGYKNLKFKVYPIEKRIIYKE